VIPKAAFYTAFLNSQGRVLNDVFIYPARGSSEDPGYLIEVDEAEVTSLLKHLKKHKLRAKLSLRALDDGERSVWATWDELDRPKWTAYNLEPDGRERNGRSSVGCVDNRAPGFGSRLLVSGEGRLPEGMPCEEVQLSTYTLRRILHGVPEGQAEILRESGLPMESNIDMMNGIDFHKGCYVGQELTIRTHHTGVIRKRILPVQLYGMDEALPLVDTPLYYPDTELALPPAGANVSKVSARKGRSAGKFLGGVGNIGLALCRLEMMTDITLTGEGSQYSPDQEFKISWDADAEGGTEAGEVKVKALVPPWTREFITAGRARKSSQRDNGGEGQRAKGMVEQLEGEVQRHQPSGH
jgi:mRNA-decapping enzyme subunit 2